MFAHPSQATVLDGIGPGIAGKLGTSMAKYCKENGFPMPERPTKGKKKKSCFYT